MTCPMPDDDGCTDDSPCPSCPKEPNVTENDDLAPLLNTVMDSYADLLAWVRVALEPSDQDEMRRQTARFFEMSGMAQAALPAKAYGPDAPMVQS